MALLAKVGDFLTTTGTSNVAVTGVGFQPKLVLFWWSGNTEGVDTAGGGHDQSGFGAMNATQQACMYGRTEDGVATTDTGRGHRTTAAVCLLVSSTDTIDGALAFSSFDADGFTLAVSDQFATSYRIHYLALGGADLTNTEIGTWQPTAGTGDRTRTGLAFAPDLLLLFGGFSTAFPNLGTDNNLFLGAGTYVGGSAQQWVWGIGNNDAVAGSSTAETICRSGQIINRVDPNNAGGCTIRASLVSLNSDGWTINFAEQGSNIGYIYVAVAGGDYRVGNFLSRTDTSGYGVTGVGFRPAALMVASAMRAEDADDTPTANQALSLGATDGTNERAIAVFDLAGADTSQVARAVDFDDVYLRFDTSDTLVGRAGVTSMDSDGFTWTHADADPDQAFIGYIAFGPGAAGGGGSSILRQMMAHHGG